ncbi:unnamed protein product [Rhizophagus irregularis]|nr:unnamed protein product [Rhizophagus irregularis]
MYSRGCRIIKHTVSAPPSAPSQELLHCFGHTSTLVSSTLKTQGRKERARYQTRFEFPEGKSESDLLAPYSGNIISLITTRLRYTTS